MYRTAIVVLILSFFPLAAQGGKVKVWYHSSPTSYDKAELKHLALATDGAIRLGRQVRPFAEMDAAHIWAVAEDPAGNLYVATGNEGKLFRVEPNGKSKLVYQSEDSQILSLTIAPDGVVYAGTGPSGRVIRIGSGSEPKVLAKLGSAYVWSLAVDSKGDVYAGTGPKGQIYCIQGDGQSRIFYTTKQEHVLCVTFASDGHLYAGTGKNGLVYRISPQGKGAVLFDAPQSEVRTLAATEQGIYAGTSAPVSRRSPSSGTARGDRSDSGIAQASFTTERVAVNSGGEAGDKVAVGGGSSGSSSSSSSGSGAPSVPPPSAKENSVYRLALDGTVREIFREKVMVLSLLERDGRLVIGTGGDGQLFEVESHPRQRTELARLDHTQVHCLCQRRDGSVAIGTGDPGKLYILGNQYAQTGTLVSEVLDAKMLSRWGALHWQADVPPETKITLATRSGNVPEPDATWSEWSAEQTNGQGGMIAAPPGRFLQYRATLVTSDAAVTPTLHTVALRYQAVNVAPELGPIEVPDYDAVALDNPKKVKIRWSATDANEDELTYVLYYRKEGWSQWVELEAEFEKREYEWDTTTTPAGAYQIKVVASDRKDNAEEEALTAERTSSRFIIDHLPPDVIVQPPRIDGSRAVVEATASDSLTRLVSASFSVDSRKWTNVFPMDGLFDGKRKQFHFKTEELKPGTHVLVLRVTDAAGNTGSSDIVFQIPAASANR
jgi:sugar lactone lactonase YvrE